MIWWLELLGICAGILLLIALAITFIVCYVRRVRKQDNARLVAESHKKYEAQNAMIESERQ